MEKANRGKEGHCLIFPSPLQGHINPMLQFSRRLQHKGIKKITLATTPYIIKTLGEKELGSSISVEAISDGFDEGGLKQAGSYQDYVQRFQEVGSKTLSQLIGKLHDDGCKIDCVVYDSFLPWILDVAKEFGLTGAVFFTQSCAVSNVYYHVQRRLVEFPVSSFPVLVPGLPPLQASDLPSLIYQPESSPALLGMALSQFSNIHEADWILCNTFHKLEAEVVDWMTQFFPMRTIGPAIPSMYLDKQLYHDTQYVLDLHKPQTEACIKWLDKKPDGSVIYVSFGSVADLTAEQIRELASALTSSNRNFLWVVRQSEEAKLPKHFADGEEETWSEKGLVVPWCPQLEVLAHKAVGCFVTHCGWNSVLEAISSGIPMVAVPRWLDQSTNARFVKDVWGVGVEARPDDKGLIRKEEILRCFEEVMEGGEKGEEMRRNAAKWRERAREAVDQGGSSDTSLSEFVDKLLHS